MRDGFSNYHPIITFGYFAIIVIFGVVFMNPITLMFSFIGAVGYGVYLGGAKATKFILTMPLGIMVVTTIFNPIFVHRGMVILFYIGDKAVTLEAIIYGFLTGVMLASIIIWFFSYNIVMTSDKFIYLFGRMVPVGSLIFSMVLKFVPNFNTKVKTIRNGQKCIGRDISNGTKKEKIIHGSKIISIMTSWSLENSIDTADSMNARGYGLKNRTNYNNYRFTNRDLVLALIVLGLVSVIIYGGMKGAIKFACYPTFFFPEKTVLGTVVLIAYGILALLPVIINVKEEMKWKYLQSKI
ncbi:MAG: energy-coupling factor transporter transmembrane component T [Anaerovoracaceae bacterium]